MSELHTLTAAEILEGLQARRFTSQQVTQAFLDQIEAHNPRLNAYLHVDASGALAAAKAADVRRAQAGDLPPLLGLPIAVKDVLAVAGLPATCGSRMLQDFVPSYNATSVQRLLDAGVVILGKTNTDEFAMGSSTENSAYGITRNPWDETRVPGGSSGGSAAAVAAGLAPVALGTDTGGSVRQPAAFCGLTGLKTSYGRVSRYGLIAYGSSLDTVGVLARSAQDAALIINVIAGYDPRDATTLEQPAPSIQPNGNPPVKGLRIGVPAEYFIEGLQPEVEAAVRSAVAELETLGASVHPVSLPHTEYALPVYYIIAPAEASANLARFDGVRYGHRAAQDSLIELFNHSRGEGFGPEVKRRIMIGSYALSAGYYDAYYGQAQKVRTLIRDDFAKAFEQVDLIAAPATPSSAFAIGAHADDPIQMYLEDVFTLPANLAGIPGLCIPAGFDAQGLPLGLQLLGPHFSEERLLHTAHTYQQVSDHHRRRPLLV